VQAHWRQAWWNLEKHEEVLYDIAWADHRNSLKNKVSPMTPASCRFDLFDEFINQAGASEDPHVENKMPQHQQQQQHQHQNQPTDMSSKRGK
jgi:hypothetical protein